MYTIRPSLPIYKLNWHTLQYALYVAINTEKLIRKGKLPNKWITYPACAACVQSKICGIISYGYSGKYSKDKINDSRFVPFLRNKLTELAPIGTKYDPENNPIGNCAEQVAMNLQIKECKRCNFCKHSQEDIYNNQEVSSSYRPRTLEFIKRCSNCSYYFGNETF